MATDSITRFGYEQGSPSRIFDVFRGVKGVAQLQSVAVFAAKSGAVFGAIFGVISRRSAMPVGVHLAVLR